MYRRYTRRLCTKSTHGSWSVRWLFSRTGYVSLFSPWPSCSCSIRVFIIWPASSVTVIRGTISAGSNFGVGRSHEPKYPAARKRPFCGLCSVGVISGERHSLYFLLHSPFSVYARLQRWFSEILPTVLCSHCYTAEREGEREREREGFDDRADTPASGLAYGQAEYDSLSWSNVYVYAVSLPLEKSIVSNFSLR